MKKAITPIIAVILLLMMTIAGASAAFFWFVKMQTEIERSAESYQESNYEKMFSSISWEDSDYDRASGNLTLYIQNTGSVRIPVNNQIINPTTSWILKNSNEDIICSAKWDGVGNNPVCTSGCGDDEYIEVGETKEIIIDLTGDCEVSGYSDGSLFYSTIYFSGKASVAGTFEK